jgi:hypothetical protein
MLRTLVDEDRDRCEAHAASVRNLLRQGNLGAVAGLPQGEAASLKGACLDRAAKRTRDSAKGPWWGRMSSGCVLSCHR